MMKAWDNIVTTYGFDYSSHIESYNPSEQRRDTLESEIAFQRSLRGIELKSFDRVSASGLFKGIEQEDWHQFGRQAVRKGEVVVREGFKELIERVQQLKGSWGIVSVSFSTEFIRGVLEESVGNRVPEFEVLANQPDVTGVLCGPKTRNGSCGKVMATSDAKLSSMTLLSQIMRSRRAPKVVYIGDSGTDIECLMEDGGVGILISEDGKNCMKECMKRLGMEAIHIRGHKLYRERGSKSIYWARNFQEIVSSPLMS